MLSPITVPMIAILFLLPAAKGLIAVRPFVSVGKALAPLSQSSSVSNHHRRHRSALVFTLPAFFGRNGKAEILQALQAINATNAEMKQSYDAQAKSIGDLHGAVVKVSENVESLQGNVESLQGNVESLQEKVETLQENFVALETSVNEVKKDMGAMQNKLGEVENKLSGSILDLKKDVKNFNKNLYVVQLLTFFAALIGAVVGTKSN